MKVKCINIYNKVTQQFQDISPWLTIGKIYVVLEIDIHSGKEGTYRLIGDNSDQGPALYGSNQFEVISGKLPSNWKVSHRTQERFTFGPEEWQQKGFWERCYEGDPEAMEIYKREARIIMREENAL